MHLSVLGQNNLEERAGKAWSELMAQDAMQGASVGVCLVDKEGGHQIFAQNEDLQLTPASTIKSLVCLTALDLFGAEHTFKTELIVQGSITQGGVLEGDLIIRGFGDPAFASPYWLRHYGNVFNQLAGAVKEAGIQTIEGDVIVDDSYFESDWLPGSTAWEDVGNYYGAEARGFNVMDNTYELLLNSGAMGDKLEVSKTIPEMKGLEFKIEAIGGNTKSDNAFIYGLPFSKERVLRGEIPANRKEFVIKGSMPDPGEWMAHRMLEELRNKEFLIFGEAYSEQTFERSDDERVLLTFESPTLDQLVRFTMSKSMNLYANVLLRHIGLELKGLGSYEAGAFTIREYWSEKGFDVSGLNIVDGSGLSRLNTISVKQLTTIIGSVTGSLEEQITSGFTKVSGNSAIRAKSGYLEGVRAYTGIITLFDGREAYFTIISNHYAGSASQARIALQHFLKSLM